MIDGELMEVEEAIVSQVSGQLVVADRAGGSCGGGSPTVDESSDPLLYPDVSSPGDVSSPEDDVFSCILLAVLLCLAVAPLLLGLLVLSRLL